MKTISLIEVVKILEDASAIIIGDTVTYPAAADLTSEPDNQFLYISWVGDEGEDYAVKFEEGPNQNVKIVGSSVFLIDDEGEECQITILEPKNLE